jgi:hypothetical protein
MLIPAGVEEALFKPTPNGWIFSAPNPWTFARRRSYLVDDVQKVELAVRVRHSRYFRVLASIAMSALPLATFLLFPSMLRAPSVGTWLLLALFTVVCTIAMNLCDYLPVRPLLVGLPRTAERIGLVEMLGRQARSMSVKALVTMALIEALASAFTLGSWLLSPRPNPYVLTGTACFGLLTILFLAMLFTKLKAQRAAV